MICQKSGTYTFLTEHPNDPRSYVVGGFALLEGSPMTTRSKVMTKTKSGSEVRHHENTQDVSIAQKRRLERTFGRSPVDPAPAGGATRDRCCVFGRFGLKIYFDCLAEFNTIYDIVYLQVFKWKILLLFMNEFQLNCNYVALSFGKIWPWFWL